MDGLQSLPPHILEELDATISSVFARAVDACDASSSLERLSMIRNSIQDAAHASLARAIYPSNARFSYQDRLPPELWFNVWGRLSVADKCLVTHVSTRWRALSVNCAELWTWIDCSVQNLAAPDGSCTRHSTLGLVPLALSRAQGMGVYIGIYMQPQDEDLYVNRVGPMLAPHASHIAQVSLWISSPDEIHTFFGVVPPLLALHTLSVQFCQASLTPSSHLPVIIPAQLLLPKLERLILPPGFRYIWPETYQTVYYPGGARSEPSYQPELHAVRILQFAPASSFSVVLALRSCPNVSSLMLKMGHFECLAEYAETPSRLGQDIAHVHLLDVPADHVDCVLSMLSVPERQCFSVAIAAISRPEPLPEWEDIPRIPYPPSPLPLEDEPHDERDILTAAQAVTVSSGQRINRFNAKKLLRHLTSKVRGVLRFRARQYDDVSVRSRNDTAPSRLQTVDDVLTPVSSVVPPAYMNILHALAALFDDLCGDSVDIILHTSADRCSTALKATDAAGRSRVAGLAVCDNGIVPELLEQVWAAHLPLDCVSRVTAELPLFPLLLASLPDEVPVRSLELLCGPNAPPIHDDGAAPSGDGGAGGHFVSLEVPIKSRFPRLRELRLGPADPDRAHQTIISAQDLAAFLARLGADVPLESLAVCRGVEVDDPAALQCLALSLDMTADPTYRMPHV